MMCIPRTITGYRRLKLIVQSNERKVINMVMFLTIEALGDQFARFFCSFTVLFRGGGNLDKEVI